MCEYCNGTARELLVKYKIGEFDGYEVPRPDTRHQGELKCRWCGRFIGWIPKPKENGERAKTPKPLSDVCEICQINKNDLGDKETIETHHVDGNPNNNLEINLRYYCSACHAIVHHQRIYRNHFVTKLNRIINSV
jgi:hypothetical protein